MIKKSKLVKKFKWSKLKFNDDSLYFINISIPQAFEIFDSASYANVKPIFESFILVVISIYQMAKISISGRRNNSE